MIFLKWTYLDLFFFILKTGICKFKTLLQFKNNNEFHGLYEFIRKIRVIRSLKNNIYLVF